MPDSENYLVIDSEAIQHFDDKYLANRYSYEKNVDGKYVCLIKINFRKCLEGEIYLKQSNTFIIKKKNLIYFIFRCLYCKYGSYSLKDGMKAESCSSCFPGVICLGGSNLQLEKGLPL